MNKLEKTVETILEEIKPHHTKTTYESRRSSFNRLLRFAEANGFKEPCQELYDAFTNDDKGSVDIRFNLSHVVRLVDRATNTNGKDRNGRLLNEPPLPAEAEAIRYFEAVKFPIDSQVDINYLIVYSECLIQKYNLSESTVGQYRHSWLDIRRRFFDSGSNYYRKQVLLDYIQEVKNLHNAGLMKTWKWKINRKAAFVLIEVAETGSFRWGRIPQYDLSCGNDELDAVRNRYLKHLESRNYEKATVCLYDYVFRSALKHGGITNYSELLKLDYRTINRIVEGFSSVCSNRSISTIIPVLRAILRFLYSEDIVKQDFSGTVMCACIQKNHVKAFIPSEDDEIIESALEKESKRNKAIILLALKLGLRDIDICTLTFDSIDWIKDKITIVQKKTNTPATLPLLLVVGNAIMGYILEDRPLPDDGFPYIFRRLQAPYSAIRSAYPICSKFIERNGIHVANNSSKGVHVFRYTLANRLLRAKIPHRVITDTLGHTSKESDKPYLAMEADMFRQCALNMSLTGSITWKEVRV